MKNFIRDLDRRTISITFGAIYGAALLFALFPPLYLWGSGNGTVIAGLPFAILYWIINAAIVGFTLWGLYIVEEIRGELDESLDEQLEAQAAALEPTGK